MPSIRSLVRLTTRLALLSGCALTGVTCTDQTLTGPHTAPSLEETAPTGIVWTALQSGSWWSPLTWSTNPLSPLPGRYDDKIIPAGITVWWGEVLGTDWHNSGTLTVYGSLIPDRYPTFNSSFTNDGIMNVYGTLDVAMGSYLINSGTLTNHGTLDVSGTRLTNSGTIVNYNVMQSGDPEGATGINPATVDNSGTIKNFGIFDNRARSTVDNSGTIENDSTFHNRDGALVHNRPSATVRNAHDLLNEGGAEIDNDAGGLFSTDVTGRTVNLSGGTIQNAGQLTIVGSTNIGGTVSNAGTLNNTGSIEVQCGGTYSGTAPTGHAPTYLCSLAVQSGDWSQGSTWNRGVAPPDSAFTFIPAGITVTVSGTAVEHGVLQSYGTLNIPGTLHSRNVSNSGLITVPSGGLLSLESGVNAPGGLSNSGAGTVNVQGTMSLADAAAFIFNQHGTINVQAGGDVENHGYLENSSGGRLTNTNGSLVNYGLIVNADSAVLNNAGGLGQIGNSGAIVNYAHLVNAGAMRAYGQGETVTIRGQKRQAGTLITSGTFENSGNFTNHDLATLTNSGTVTNSGTLASDSPILNASGTLNNQCHGVISAVVTGNQPVDVCPVGTTTTIAAGVNPSTYGLTDAFTVTVTPATGAGIPTGTVQLLLDGAAWATATLSGGSATSPSLATLPVGNHLVTANYLGGATFIQSSASYTQVVHLGVVTPLLVPSVNPSGYGQDVGLTVILTGAGGGTPTGTVTFMDGGAGLGSVPVANASATLSLSSLAPGSHVLTAAYSGDGNYAPTTSLPVTQVVSAVATTIAITTSANPSTYGLTPPVTVTVTTAIPGAGTPTGLVHLTLDGNPLPDAVLQGGQVTGPDMALLSVANHAITASYEGDATFAASAASYTQVVHLGTPTVSLTSPLNPAVYGQPLVLTATLSGYGAGTPTGTITLREGSVGVTLPAAVVNGSAQITYCCQGIGAWAVGTHSLSAVYSGDVTHYAQSTSPVLAQTITQAATSTRVASAINPSVVGQAVQFTATVRQQFGGINPSGTAQWTVDGANAGTSSVYLGSTKFTLSALSVGVHQVAVTYLGDSSYISSTSPAFAQTVNPPPNSPPIASAGGPYGGSEGSAITFNAAGSSDPDNDPLTYDWAFGDGATAIDAGAAPSHTYADNGSFTATVTVRDDHGHATPASTTVSVANVAPVVSSIPGAQLIQGETYSAAGTFTDPGADTYDASVDWGDGSSAQLASEGSAFDLAHGYGAAGTYTVAVTVTDDDGGVGRSTATVTVLSPAAAAQALGSYVQDLARHGDIRDQTARQLGSSASAAAGSLERGHTNAAAEQLRAFIKKVRSEVETGRIDAATGAALTDYARRVLAALGEDARGWAAGDDRPDGAVIHPPRAGRLRPHDAHRR